MKKIFLILFLLFSGKGWAGGTIFGTVLFQGVPPHPKKVSVTLDQQACGNQVISEDLVVGKKGGIKNAVVYLQGSLEGLRPYPTPEGGFVMDQKGCRFEPHVRIVAQDAALQILNSDPTLHNFHTLSRLNPEINKAQPRSLPKMTLSWRRPEIFEVRCDVHDWMHAWLVVAEHPYYAVTNDEGYFQLTDVPAGEYTVTLWHETLGTRGKRVQVQEGKESRVEFKFSQQSD